MITDPTAPQPMKTTIAGAALEPRSQPVPVPPHALAQVPETTHPLAARTGAEQFWYVLQNIAFGAAYFAKIPMKAALRDAGLVRLTGAEQFWYVLQCIAFGGGYFAKVIAKKALSEVLIQNS
jgi:hypothetical protein